MRIERTGTRPTRTLGPGTGRVAARDQVTVPTQHSVGAHQQPCPAQHTAREPVQQRGQEHPVTRGEPHPIPAELAFQHGDLISEPL